MKSCNRFRFRRKMSRLISCWLEYRSLFQKERKGEEPNNEILELKGQMASLLQWLGEHLPESLQESGEIRIEEILGMLEEDDVGRKESPDDFEGKWLAHYLFLNRLRGTEPAFDSTGSSQGTSGKASLPWFTVEKGQRHFGLLSPARLLAFLGMVLILGKALGFHREAGQWALERPGNAKEVLGNLSSLLPFLRDLVFGFFRPLLEGYGVAGLLALTLPLGALLAFLIRFRR
ncbi:MAG: hypothetical protein QF492_01325 [Candidatus Krumholzibacteria bacterium]|nr:hypothetical protein [Candidatus Krumholzibacteria bacterium]MDP6668533.1 hypothetical protein [Candidatus Krumholzibacteria bacterium]MDP6797793.1 hypothetical protein [Candidatus Krumholzibacteria bacterium]MDP7021414.1 hypothetical protein [Candidatus Krumholzibacteria bacterium]